MQKLFADVNAEEFTDILVVTHGSLIYRIDCHLYKLGVIVDFPKPDPRNASTPNTNVTKLSLGIDPEGCVVSGKCLIFMSGSHLDN